MGKLCLLVGASFVLAYAQGPGNDVAEEHRAEVSREVKVDRSPRALSEMQGRPVTGPARGGRDFEPGKPDAVAAADRNFNDPLAVRGSGPVSARAIVRAAGITGTGVDPNYRVAPPDTTGDLSEKYYVQWVNLRFSVYDVSRDSNKQITGFSLRGGFPKQGNAIWAGFGGTCENSNDGDPIVQYDQFADRWILTQFAVSSTPYMQCVAVSTSGDPTGTYNRYAFSYGIDFPDFPKMAVWEGAYVITYNIFRRGRTFTGNKVCAFERDRMLAGLSARQICAQTSSSYHSLVPGDIEGSTPPDASAANPLLSITSTALHSWRFAYNWTSGTGALSGPYPVAGVAAFSRACGGGTCIPQAGTTRLLDSLGDRLNYRLSYRKGATHESLVINHAVTASGATGIRWYELRNAAGQTVSTATPVIHQQGTFSPNSDYRWMGSAAIDKTGGIAVGYNISSSALKPSIAYAFRGPSDTLGAMGGETTILSGAGSQTGTLSRWGDYSTLSVDPVDGCTMVFTTEYLPSDGSFNWATYIHSFKLSTCN